ncbi:MAG TPA: hypothetical protein DEP18_06705 [Flavobacteriales bacterium]|nr:hypothetical protein [Flavobacteriales bacterium]
MARVQMLSNNQWRYGYIDTTGKLVIPSQFEKASDFRDGVAWIKVPGGDFQLINTNGKIISKKSYKKEGMWFLHRNSPPTWSISPTDYRLPIPIPTVRVLDFSTGSINGW